jgi:dipeptidyl aminopeptidase/acylaminoacyl peptidase
MSFLPLYAIEIEDISFKAKLDGTEQHYLMIRPAGFPELPVPILIALHGHGSDRFQFAKDQRDECRSARDAAIKFRMLYISPDYRAKTSWMGPAAEADTVQIIEQLKKQFKITKVVICGGSMGGTSALTLAALHPELIDGVVSMNGTANLVEYTQFQDAISTSFGGSKQASPEEYRKRSAELNAGKLTMPIAFTTGGRDTVVPCDSILRLSANLLKSQKNIKLIHRPEGGHETSYADATEAFDFVIRQVLQSKPGMKE